MEGTGQMVLRRKSTIKLDHGTDKDGADDTYIFYVKILTHINATQIW